MNEQTAMISSAALSKVDNCADNILVGDILDMIFRPLESEKLDRANISIVG